MFLDSSRADKTPLPSSVPKKSKIPRSPCTDATSPSQPQASERWRLFVSCKIRYTNFVPLQTPICFSFLKFFGSAEDFFTKKSFAFTLQIPLFD